MCDKEYKFLYKKKKKKKIQAYQEAYVHIYRRHDRDLLYKMKTAKCRQHYLFSCRRAYSLANNILLLLLLV